MIAQCDTEKNWLYAELERQLAKNAALQNEVERLQLKIEIMTEDRIDEEDYASFGPS